MKKRYTYQELLDLGLTEAEIEVCRVMRLDPQVFKETKEHGGDPGNIDPHTGTVSWGKYRAAPLTSREEAMASAREAKGDQERFVDTSPLEIF